MPHHTTGLATARLLSRYELAEVNNANVEKTQKIAIAMQQAPAIRRIPCTRAGLPLKYQPKPEYSRSAITSMSATLASAGHIVPVGKMFSMPRIAGTEAKHAKTIAIL